MRDSSPPKKFPVGRRGPAKGSGGRPKGSGRLDASLGRYAWVLDQQKYPHVRIAERLFGFEDRGYVGKGLKDAHRAAVEKKVRRLIDRGYESMVKDLGLKPRVFRQRVPWVREANVQRPKRKR